MPYFHTPFIRVGTVIQQEIATDTVLFQGGTIQLGAGGALTSIVANTGFCVMPGVIVNNTALGYRMSGFFTWTGAGTKNTLACDTNDLELGLVNRTTGNRRLNTVSGVVQTGAGATATVAATAALTDNAVTTVEARVTGGKSDESEGASYLLVAAYRRAGAGPVICGAVTPIWTLETDATANATLAIVGNTIEVQVTSPAGDTYDWMGSVDLEART